MTDLLKRIEKRLKDTARAWQNDSNFSQHLAVYRVQDELGGRLGFKRLSEAAHEKKDAFILNWMEQLLDPVFDKFRTVNCPGEHQKNAPVWVCWWTGVETAPPLVKQCISSIQANAGETHPVVILSGENIAEYLDIPPFILEKHMRGQMGTAHLCDYVRVALLEKYGGLWLDATIFCAFPLPEVFFDQPFFTCKSPFRVSGYLSHYQWVTFCLGGWRGNIVFRYLKEAFEEYWIKNDCAIDYLMFDYLIYIGRKSIPAMKKFMDDVPENTPHRDDLQATMNMALPAEEFWNVVQADTPIYKLSWRETYREQLPDGQQTIYGYFLGLTFEGDEKT